MAPIARAAVASRNYMYLQLPAILKEMAIENVHLLATSAMGFTIHNKRIRLISFSSHLHCVHYS